jgi:putative hydrolase of the HAD superfamily
MPDLSLLDTLILDLGGVLIDVDYDRSAKAFTALGMERFEEQFSKARQTRLFDEFETGTITPTRFRDAIRDMFGRPLKDREIDRCWNAMLGSIPSVRMELVEALRMRYRVYLLSNTNAIHVPAFLEIVHRENRLSDFRKEFDGCYFSNELGLRKPDAAIFQHVLRETFASPERTLFIDDSIQHVEGARKAGLPAEHLDLSKEDVIQLVDRIGLLR